MSRLILRVLLFLMLCLSASGASYYYAGDYTSWTNAYAQCVNGDIILWTNASNYTLTNGQNLIINGPNISFINTGGGWILDGITSEPGGASSSAVISIQPSTHALMTTVYNFTFGNNGGTDFNHGCVQFALGYGNGNGRITGCTFTNINEDSIFNYSGYPLVDHCHFFENNVNTHAFQVWDGVANNGDVKWTNSRAYYSGTSNAFFVEYCDFTGPGPTASWALMDSYCGGNWVFRDCTTTNGFIGTHGTESSGIYRGTPYVEFYNNYISNGITINYGCELRSASGIAFSNVFVGAEYAAMRLSHYRASTKYNYWSNYSATNILDNNNPTNYLGPQTTITVGTGGAEQLVFADSGVTANQYSGCSFLDVSQYPTSTFFGMCYSNSPTTSGNVTCYFMSVGDSQPVWTSVAGETINIYYPLSPTNHGLDECGWIQSSGLMARNGSTGAPLLTQTEPTNHLATLYSWNNTWNGADTGWQSQNPMIRTNIEFINDTPMPGYAPYIDPDPRDTNMVSVISSSASLQINGNGTVSVSGNGVITIH